MKRLANIALAALLLSGSFAGLAQAAETAEQKKPASAYVASSLREPFHRPDCKWGIKISSANLKTFQSRNEAIQAGHRPCKVCKP
jgi:micrococcal nuclease